MKTARAQSGSSPLVTQGTASEDSNYQHKLCGLELDLTALKVQNERLLGEVAELKRSRDSLQELFEQRVAERTAELERKVRELQTFSHTLSHDMRGPLRTMQGYAELLGELCGEKIGVQEKEYLKRILASAHRLDSMVEDGLKYSKSTKSQGANCGTRVGLAILPRSTERMAGKARAETAGQGNLSLNARNEI